MQILVNIFLLIAANLGLYLSSNNHHFVTSISQKDRGITGGLDHYLSFLLLVCVRLKTRFINLHIIIYYDIAPLNLINFPDLDARSTQIPLSTTLLSFIFFQEETQNLIYSFISLSGTYLSMDTNSGSLTLAAHLMCTQNYGSFSSSTGMV